MRLIVWLSLRLRIVAPPSILWSRGVLRWLAPCTRLARYQAPFHRTESLEYYLVRGLFRTRRGRCLRQVGTSLVSPSKLWEPHQSWTLLDRGACRCSQTHHCRIVMRQRGSSYSRMQFFSHRWWSLQCWPLASRIIESRSPVFRSRPVVFEEMPLTFPFKYEYLLNHRVTTRPVHPHPIYWLSMADFSSPGVPSQVTCSCQRTNRISTALACMGSYRA